MNDTPEGRPNPEDDRAQSGAAEQTDEAPASPPERSTARRVLGCLGIALLVFFVIVLLVFGACLMVLNQ